TKDGKVYLYGKLTDRRMSSIPENMGVVVDISAGHNHLLALNEDGDVFTWGYNRFGLDSVPSEVESLRGEIKSINAGYQISHVLSENGEVVYWGNENLMEIYGLSNYQGNIDDIEFNTSTGMVLTKDNEVYALARSNTPVKAVPEEIQGKVVSIALAEKAAVAILDDGSLVVWGEGRDSRFAPTDEMDGHLFASVEAGRNHFTAITVDGKVFSWGDNNYGQTNVPSALNNQTVVAVETDFHQSYAITADGKLYSWGLSGHLMGTDGDGRDVFTRLVAGGRMTMTVGAIAVIIATIIGVIIGGISGYYGGTLIDNFLMRIAEIVGGLPFLPFAMILSNILGNSITETQRIMLIMVILGLLSWPPLARLARAQILAEREKEFVTAAKAVGIREVSIIFKHILPNVITVLIVSTTLSFASSMLTESTLSFLGFGVIEPNPTWGNMLNKAQDSKVIKDYWWQWIFPALALSLSTISINCVGDGLRDAIDPHSNDR
ncbi:MAG: ABC transporter permease subunit, partial [Spirochaetales bacterium]